MNLQQSLCGCALLSLLPSLGGCSGTDDFSPGERAAGTGREAFSTYPEEPNHEEITALGLSFLRPEILLAMQVANVETDVQFVLETANHFDGCNFTGGAQVVQESQAEAVARLNPRTASQETDVLVIRAFARSLHALQDFYAHTNWIELGATGLVDSSLGAFPRLRPYATVAGRQFVIVQGQEPKNVVLARDEGAAYPSNAVVTVQNRATRASGLISGTVDYENGNSCPASVAMTHAELNKDKSSLAERVEQHEEAKTAAILQTEHEWCRLRSLAGRAWGEPAVARLDSWVSAGAAPDCQLSSGGPKPVPPPPGPPAPPHK